MIAEILKHSDTIEECYEFMLGYAAQGLPSEVGHPQVRTFLRHAVEALRGLEKNCAEAIEQDRHQHAERHLAALLPFLLVLHRDAADSLATLRLVLAQPAISSQLIDNLNASVHLRALLTDLFLLSEVLRNQPAAEEAASGTTAPQLQVFSHSVRDST
jgi:hypothetical protein